MNKKQRFDKLFLDEHPGDDILFYPILMHFAARFHGKTYGEFASDYRVLVESNIKCMEYFDMDIVSLISDPYRETSAFGAPVKYVPEGVPVCQKIIVGNIDDVKNLTIPDVHKKERTLDRINGARYYQQLLKGTVPVMGWIEGPLAEACDLAGVSQMLVYLMTDPDLCNLLMDKCMVMAKQFAAAQVDAGCDLIGVGDAICSQIDEGLYAAYVKERHIDLINYIHSLGARVKFHICGNTTHLLPHLAEIGLDMFDPDIVDQEECFRILGKEVVRFGNINPVFIETASPDELQSACSEALNKEKDRKFILSGGCEITVRTPAENLKIMSESRFRKG